METKRDAGSVISKIKAIDVSAVEGNNILAADVGRGAIERCKDVYEGLGVVHTPIVGMTKSGGRLLLSGQRELTALRELGVKKMDAIEVEVSDDRGSKAKLLLRLMSLRDTPGALCEGQLLREAVNAGVGRAEIQSMLGKSASWVSNRLSLVTRLDGNVYEMVRNGLLDPRSAQEIARLPIGAQSAFAEAALMEGLPKSAIEPLVAGYRDESCPDAVKSQILSDPRAALARITDKRRAIKDAQAGRRGEYAPPNDIEGRIKAMKAHAAAFNRILLHKTAQELNRYNDALDELGADLEALLRIVRGLVSPGKMEACANG